jgi:DNA-binding response OmpR family regulator
MNAGDALMLVPLSRPDAIVLDIRLPDRSGADLLPDLLAIDESLTVVMLTGLDDEAVARATLNGGAFDYVRKPFNLETIERAVTVAVAVGRQRPPRGVVVPFRPGRRGPKERPEPLCPRCQEPVVDNSAVVEKGVLFHAACWMQNRRPSRQS